MFGYLVPNRGELKVRELERYRSWYCGLCQRLKSSYGLKGRLALSYDMTFLAILLSSLYDDRVSRRRMICPAHPLQRRSMLSSDCLDYCADMNVLLAYYNFLDDWTDEKDPAAFLQAQALKKDIGKLEHRYPRQTLAVRTYVKDLSALEKEGQAGPEEGAVLTGKMLAQIFDMQGGIWSGELSRMGFYLGKFIYLTDAYEDLEKDLQTGSYNPLKETGRAGDLDETCRSMLLMQIAPCCQAFEILPLIRDVNILRNILYSGVWSGFMRASKARMQQDEQAGNKRLVKR